MLKNILFTVLIFFISTAKAAVVTFDFEVPPNVYIDNYLNPQFTQDGITITHVGNLSINPDAKAQWADGARYNGTDGAMRITQSNVGGLPTGAYANISTDIFKLDLRAVRWRGEDFIIEAWSELNGTGTLISSISVVEDQFLTPVEWGAYSFSSNTGIRSLSFIGKTNHAAWDDMILHTSPVIPIPAAVWLFSSGLLGLIGVARRKKA